MTTPPIQVFEPTFNRRIVSAVLRTERTLDAHTRPKRTVIGGGGCDRQNTIWAVTAFGKPTFGTFSLDVTAGGVTETITFNWDDDKDEVKAAMAGHSQLTTDDLTVTGGPFPNATMLILFKGAQAGKDIALPPANWDALGGGVGVAVIMSLYQKGHR